jgi:hypothetical protein
MKLEWKKDSFALTKIDPFVAELLRRLPGCAAVDDSAAHARIFPSPTGGKEAEADEDWRENVEPELQELFASHVDVVVSDLAGLKVTAEAAAEEKKNTAESVEDAEEEEAEEADFRDELEEFEDDLPTESLVIPTAHSYAWIHTLNQARLALGERHRLTEKHLNHGDLPEKQQDALAVIQVEFYGYLLSYLLRFTEL